jgi:hypothetical protein
MTCRFAIEQAVQETTFRKGFLTDQQYAVLGDALAEDIRLVSSSGNITGILNGELLRITWPQVGFESRLVTLEYGETKPGASWRPDYNRRRVRRAISGEEEAQGDVAPIAIGIRQAAKR